MAEALAAATAGNCPVAVLAAPGTFSGKKAVAPQPGPEETRPTREGALEAVLRAVKPGDAVVGTTGYTSRELYELRSKLGMGHEADFLCVGLGSGAGAGSGSGSGSGSASASASASGSEPGLGLGSESGLEFQLD